MKQVCPLYRVQFSAVDMYAEDLDGNNLICYPVIQGEQINYQNK